MTDDTSSCVANRDVVVLQNGAANPRRTRNSLRKARCPPLPRGLREEDMGRTSETSYTTFSSASALSLAN
ncbi:hypothetical protein TSMEX_005005 [Taenia solium]|eukprot:TsM_000595500 transcript=TsM_000595500 gene=TsM_000595500